MGEKWSLKEFLKLFMLSLSVKLKNLSEFFKTVFLYYRNLSFAQADLLLLSSYLFKNPFSISKKFLLKKGEDEIYVYGETPLTSMAHIAKMCAFQADDHLFELGMGRGRCCFWLHYFVGCKVTGIELIPEFVQKADGVKNRLKIDRLFFLTQDMLESDFSEGTCFYLYGTCYDEPFIKALIKKFKELKKGTKIITVSYSLNEFTKIPHFKVEKTFPVSFTWGIGDVYVQTIL